MEPEKKKFEDIRKPLEEHGYEIVKSIGKGAFGEVVLALNSTPSNMQNMTPNPMLSKSSTKHKSRRNPSSKNT